MIAWQFKKSNFLFSYFMYSVSELQWGDRLRCNVPLFLFLFLSMYLSIAGRKSFLVSSTFIVTSCGSMDPLIFITQSKRSIDYTLGNPTLEQLSDIQFFSLCLQTKTSTKHLLSRILRHATKSSFWHVFMKPRCSAFCSSSLKLATLLCKSLWKSTVS